MKKIIRLLIVGLLFISCSDSEDKTVIDPIIGEWKLVERFENDVLSLTFCDLGAYATVHTFYIDNSATTVGHEEDNGEPNGECIRYSQAFTWEGLGNDIYRTQSTEGLVEEGKLYFENNNNRFYFLDESSTTTIKSVFQRQ